MDETFYTALGVESDADDETVRDAYRKAVKEHHPDVSDDPGAERRFKRLTTARDVLLDPDERARYDRLGHQSYVSNHLEAPTWSGGGGGGDVAGSGDPGGDWSGAPGSRRTGGAGDGAAGGHRARAAERAAWLGDHDDGHPGRDSAGEESIPGSRRHRGAAGRRRHVRADADAAATPHQAEPTASDPGVDEPWQTASDTYTRSAAASRAAAARSDATSFQELLSALGPWLVIHLVFIASAVATAVFTLSEANAYFQLSLPAFLLGLVLFGLVVGLSVLHLVSQVVS